MLHIQPPADRGTVLGGKRGCFGVLCTVESLESNLVLPLQLLLNNAVSLHESLQERLQTFVSQGRGR